MKEFFKKVNIKRAVKYALYMFLALVCQDMLFTQLRIAGVCPMFLPAVAIAVGMFEGASWGAVFGLIMGVFADMAFVENTILFTVLFPALSFMAGFVAHFSSTGVFSRSWWRPPPEFWRPLLSRCLALPRRRAFRASC